MTLERLACCLEATLNLTRGKSRLPFDWSKGNNNNRSKGWNAKNSTDPEMTCILSRWLHELPEETKRPTGLARCTLPVWIHAGVSETPPERWHLIQQQKKGLFVIESSDRNGMWRWIDWNGRRVSCSFYHRTDDDGGESLSIASSFKAFLHDRVIFITNMDFNSIQLYSSRELIVDCPLQNRTQKLYSIRQLFLATLMIFGSFYTCFYH